MAKRRYLRFSLGTLLVLMSALAGYLGAYRSGYQAGEEAFATSRIYVESYPVTDLVLPWDGSADPVPEFDDLIDLIETTVGAGAWNSWDGRTGIRGHTESESLVVSQTSSVHAEISELLAQLQSLYEKLRERLARGLCGHCGKAPTPKVGGKCPKCGQIHVEPR